MSQTQATDFPAFLVQTVSNVKQVAPQVIPYVKIFVVTTAMIMRVMKVMVVTVIFAMISEILAVVEGPTMMSNPIHQTVQKATTNAPNQSANQIPVMEIIVLGVPLVEIPEIVIVIVIPVVLVVRIQIVVNVKVVDHVAMQTVTLL